MAEASVLLAQDQICCLICLDLLKDPVAIPCGHRFCMVCIEGFWDKEDPKGVYSCPQCRQTLTPRPVLVCSQHDKPLEAFCRTDQMGICMLCAMGEHKYHDTVSIAEERNEKQKELGKSQTKFQVIIKEKENHLQDLRQAVKTLQCSADAAVENSERIFTEMTCSIEKRRSEVSKLIRDQERADVSRAEELTETLDQEIIELKRRVAELGQFSNSENNILFLNRFQALCVACTSDKSSSCSVRTDVLFERVTDSLGMLKEKVQDVLKKGLQDVTDTGENISIFTPPEPVTRGDFLKYSCQLTLDPNTAHNFLSLSDGNRVVEHSSVRHQYPEHVDRFDVLFQVMCNEATSTRCYWEVQLSGRAFIAVSYKGLQRKGNHNTAIAGYNAISWSLDCCPSGFWFIHDDKLIKLHYAQTSPRIGVYVDHRAGTLCFYSVTDKMTLLYKVETTFTEPLYPVFWVAIGSKITLGR